MNDERRARQSKGEQDWSDFYVHVDVAKISVLLVCTTEDRENRSESMRVSPMNVSLTCRNWYIDQWFLFPKKGLTLLFNFIQCTFEIKKDFLTFAHSIFQMIDPFVTRQIII